MINNQLITSQQPQNPSLSQSHGPKKEATDVNKGQYVLQTSPDSKKITMYINEIQHTQQNSYLLDQKELNDLLSVNVQQLALQAQSNHTTRHRKNSDEDVYVEETLLFVLPQSQTALQDPPGLKQAQDTIDQLLQSINDLRSQGLQVQVHTYDEVQFLKEEERIIRLQMEFENPDDEIDKLLETFEMSGIMKNNLVLNHGDFIENDIRINEVIRDIIDEVKSYQRPSNNKNQEMERRKFLQKYIEVAEQLGVSFTVEHLLPTLQELFKQDIQSNCDKGYLKFIYAQMDKLISFLSQSEITVGYNGLRDFIMPFFNDFFKPDYVEETLRQDLQGEVIELLVKITKIMTTEDRKDKVLPIVLNCIRDDAVEENRILGLELLDRLAEDIGKDDCQNFLMYEIVSLQDDPIYRVRKETVMRMINISKVLGKEIFLGILFPVFKKLANDSIWGVRRAAVEVLPQISNLCPPEIKNGILIEMFKKFSQDSSKWVKMATFQFLGPFIASYEGVNPNPLLIDYYIGMLEQNKSPAPDNEVPYYCAYNFPAVLLTLGTSFWPKLYPIYDQLVRDQRFKVRRTLAFSLHEIAKILGPEITEKDLIPVLHHFLKDTNEVREGVALNISKFIEVLSPQQREQYVEQLAQTQIDNQDWRKRVTQAKQIRQFCKIFSHETVYKYYVPVFFQLCEDQVAEVRQEASRCAKNVTQSLSQNDLYLAKFIQRILALKQSTKFFLRQTFIQVCFSVIHNQSVFEKYLMNELCRLASDRVVNVRIVLAECLGKYHMKDESKSIIPKYKQMIVLLDKLQRDQEYVSQLVWDIDIGIIPEDLQDEQSQVPIQSDLASNEEQTSQVTENQSEDKESLESLIVNSQVQETIEVTKIQEETQNFETEEIKDNQINEISNEDNINESIQELEQIQQQIQEEQPSQIDTNEDPIQQIIDDLLLKVIETHDQQTEQASEQ